MYGWMALLVAIAFEIAGTTFMKLSDGFAKLGPSIGLVVCYAFSFGALTLALRTVDIGVGYAIWSGMGTAAIAVIGVILFGEVLSFERAFWIMLIVVGVVGLQLSSVR
ncbi:MAG: multidrug efflux SMR transporter [Pseudomonadales bacterium]|jgi:small multidrug resistance pump|nr:multidrug efflux SMR transporter [Pseudomonadales bacterium]